ncbi:hypothetical protein U1Q18_047155, partial [Sarracenia purpurea var. burkii]
MDKNPQSMVEGQEENSNLIEDEDRIQPLFIALERSKTPVCVTPKPSFVVLSLVRMVSVYKPSLNATDFFSNELKQEASNGEMSNADQILSPTLFHGSFPDFFAVSMACLYFTEGLPEAFHGGTHFVLTSWISFGPKEFAALWSCLGQWR